MSATAKQDVAKLESIEFDIFRFSRELLQSELVITTSYILCKEELFSSSLTIPFDTFIRFMTRISQGYKSIPYHNKTHAADVS